MGTGVDMTDSKITMQKAIDTYGISAQVDVAIEEMAELTKALLKVRRDGPIEDVLEEMADTKIMLVQLEMIYGPVDGIVEQKLARLHERLARV